MTSRDIHRSSSIPSYLSLSIEPNDEDVDAFYESRVNHFLRNPSRARNEITLFARRAGVRLRERLPRLARVPHRVTIVDERETQRSIEESTLLQIKHKHNLSLIARRRQLLTKMMIQAKKNQNKMEKSDMQASLKMSHSFCCRDLLERVDQIERALH